MPSQRTRRDVLKASFTAGIGYWVSTRSSFAFDSKSPNERTRVACIGVGGKGTSDMQDCARLGEVVAICDVDESVIAEAAGSVPDAEQFFDFRELLDKMGDKIDAVTISTPDHTHASAAMMAIKKGKHVYVQKPLTWSVSEARALLSAARDRKVVTQMGNQGSADGKMREGVEAIQAGVLGPVREVHVWTDRPIWPQSPRVTARPPEMAPPESLHWDLWLGPAPHRPYAEGRLGKKIYKPYHKFNWRGWWDFGSGALGDMWCHLANLSFRALKLQYPTTVWAESTELNNETFPAGAHVVWEFAERGSMPPVTVHWYEGKKDNGKGERYFPPKDLFHGETPSASGSLMVGEKGVLYSPVDYGEEWVLLPRDRFAQYRPPARTIPRLQTTDAAGTDREKPDSLDRAMKKEWFDAIRGKGETFAGFEFSAPFTETALLGNIAMHFQPEKLKFDAEKCIFTNKPEASKFFGRTYREGWTL